MADVKLLESQRLTDAPDGGGLMTSNEVVDGVVNNLFPDISRVDRTYGVVNLRKAYLKADTADTAIYNGLHAIILDGPDDERVSASIFTTNNWADEREDAQAQIERYLDQSVITQMIPFDRQLAGARQVLAFQRPDLPLPEIGKAYVLTAIPAETQYQFYRVTNVEHSVQTFTDETYGVDFQVRVITMTITEPLQQTYQGTLPNKFFKAGTNTSKIRSTVVSDAARYHTIHNLAADAAVDDLTIKLDSVYAQIVPSTTSESPIIDAHPAGTFKIVASGPSYTHEVGVTPVWNHDGAISFLPTAVTPGTLELHSTFPGSSIVVDDGVGNLCIDTTSGRVLGTIEYDTGRITIGDYTGSDFLSFVNDTAVYLPAATINGAAMTAQIPVTQSTRGYVYNLTMNPIPSPGTLSVSYRALGNWITLIDDGSGALFGAEGEGSGSVNFLTGTATVSLGALPDIDSSVIFSWGSDTEYEIRTTDTDIDTPIVTGTLSHSVTPGTVSVDWTANSVAKNATDNGAGLFTGDATGFINYTTGEFRLRPDLLPDKTTAFAFAYDDQSATLPTSEDFTPTPSAGNVSMTLSSVPVRPGSISLGYPVEYSSGQAVTLQMVDDGNGGFIYTLNGAAVPGASINYTTGAIVIPQTLGSSEPVYTYANQTLNLPGRTIDPGAIHYFPGPVPVRTPVGSTIV